MGIRPGGMATRLIAMDGPDTLLKARLLRTPSHPRALQWLLEGVALWQGHPVRAVLSAEPSASACGAHLYTDWFPDFGGPLYTIEWAPAERPRRARDGLSGLGDFRDLKQLRMFDAQVKR